MQGKKPWYTSKTVWATIATIGVGIYQTIAPAAHLPSIPTEVLVALGALGLYGRVTATREIGTQP